MVQRDEAILKLNEHMTRSNTKRLFFCSQFHSQLLSSSEQFIRNKIAKLFIFFFTFDAFQNYLFPLRLTKTR